MISRLTVLDPIDPAEALAESRGRNLPISRQRVTPHETLGSRCDVCRFRVTCLGNAFQTAGAGAESLVGCRRTLAQGHVLYHAGAKCSSVYVVQAGFFKTIMLSEDGIAQVTAFEMPGDLLGMDGLCSGIHRSDAVALSPSSVCVVPRARLLQSSAENGALGRQILGVLSDEIATDHSTMLLLGSRSAEERVAGFIAELSQRLSARGYPASEIGLWMTREEIGSYLGLELETISRVLSNLRKRHLLDVHRRHIHIRDLAALRGVVVGREPSTQGRAVHGRATRVAEEQG